jgi:2'-5' RNA ligase
MSAEEAAKPLRLFVALDLPEPVKHEVERAQAELRARLTRSLVKWTRRAQFHLTLRFLGDVEAARVDALVNAIESACEGVPPLELRASGIGFFPGIRSPRVIWAGISDNSGALQALQRALQARTQAFTQEVAESRFAGHVTLGRVRQFDRAENDALAQAARTFAKRSFGSWRSEQLELIRSELSSAGSMYTTIARVRLAS